MNLLDKLAAQAPEPGIVEVCGVQFHYRVIVDFAEWLGIMREAESFEHSAPALIPAEDMPEGAAAGEVLRMAFLLSKLLIEPTAMDVRETVKLSRVNGAAFAHLSAKAIGANTHMAAAMEIAAIETAKKG